jgi:hypothetical protein
MGLTQCQQAAPLIPLGLYALTPPLNVRSMGLEDGELPYRLSPHRLSSEGETCAHDKPRLRVHLGLACHFSDDPCRLRNYS